MNDAVIQNRNKKFDLQLSQALIDERRLADIFMNAKLERIELKSESWQWERTGNIAIEYRRKGQPSGISTTEATAWVHELKRDGKTLCYLVFPIDRLKELCRRAIKDGNSRLGGGDGGEFDVVVLPLSDILR
jgi:hypothetical protein